MDGVFFGVPAMESSINHQLPLRTQVLRGQAKLDCFIVGIEHHDKRIIFNLLPRLVTIRNGSTVEIDHQRLAKVMIPVVLSHQSAGWNQPRHITVTDIGAERTAGKEALPTEDGVVTANSNDALGKGV